jgi:hypothetical protein
MGPCTCYFPVFLYFQRCKDREFKENSRWRGRRKHTEIKHKQINILFIYFDGVGLCVQRILILYKN